MSLSETIAALRVELDNVEKETRSLESGRKASASRIRKSLQNIKTRSHGMRKDVVTFSKALPTKSRKTKIPDPEPAADDSSL
jgi:hypothetical protein